MVMFSCVKCDKCGTVLPFHFVFSKGDLTRWSREKGWSIGKQELCPKCRRKRKVKAGEV